MAKGILILCFSINNLLVALLTDWILCKTVDSNIMCVTNEYFVSFRQTGIISDLMSYLKLCCKLHVQAILAYHICQSLTFFLIVCFSIAGCT